MVVGCWLFLAVGGQFRPFQTLRFAVTFQTVHMPPLTSPCNPNFGPPKVPHFFSMRTTQPQFDFQLFLFWGFAGSGTVTSGFSGKFQYRTPRFRGVSCPPCPENLVRKIFCSTFGEFQGAVVCRLPGRREIINYFSAGLPGRQEIINNSGIILVILLVEKRWE